MSAARWKVYYTDGGYQVAWGDGFVLSGRPSRAGGGPWPWWVVWPAPTVSGVGPMVPDDFGNLRPIEVNAASMAGAFA